jgi:pimeloyl-ACP methyl ester carboxylesterase
MKNFIYLLIVVALITSCEKSDFLTDGDFFHLDHKGAQLPVWVKGNKQSDVIIIFLHGGPGGSGMDQSLGTGFKYLEEDYTLVYWTQRFSGLAQGHCNTDLVTPDQFIEDTEKIVELIKYKYPNKTLFMMGHSWGGQLSAGYLGRNNHANQFNGWINVDGAIYAELESQLMKDWILEKVPAKLAEPNADTTYWQSIIDWYKENPSPGNYSEAIPYYYVSELGGSRYNLESESEDKTPFAQLIFKSMFTMSFFTTNFYNVIERWDNVNYTQELKNINIPTLLLWGENDGQVPADVADYVYEHLGTDESQKTIVKVPECAHAIFYEKPNKFYQQIKDFIETYK